MLRSERVAEGFAVAALAHRDHDGRAAARGLTAGSALQAGVLQLAAVALDSPSRRAFLHAALQPARAYTGSSSGVTSSALLRARGLLARTLEQSEPQIARAWLRAAPLPRPGFRAEPQLIAHLAKLCAKHCTTQPRADRALMEQD